MPDKKINLLHLAAVALVSIVAGLLLKAQFGGDWFEFAGFTTGVIGVYLAAIEHISNYAMGLLNFAIYGYVFYQAKLYADMSLQGYFFVLCVMGWVMWARGGDKGSALPVSRISLESWGKIALMIAIGTALYFPIIKYFGGAFPLVDSALTVGSIVGQLLLNAKKIENWVMWIVVDVFYIPLYVSRGLYSTAVLYGFFLILAVLGLARWSATLKQTDQPTLVA